MFIRAGGKFRFASAAFGRSGGKSMVSSVSIRAGESQRGRSNELDGQLNGCGLCG